MCTHRESKSNTHQNYLGVCLDLVVHSDLLILTLDKLSKIPSLIAPKYFVCQTSSSLQDTHMKLLITSDQFKAEGQLPKFSYTYHIQKLYENR